MLPPVKTALYLGLSSFFILRIISLIHYLYTIPTIYTGISILTILTFAYISTKRLDIGLIILLSEIILGGTGNFLSLWEINLRTWLLCSYAAIWSIHIVRTGQWDIVRITHLSTRILSILTGIAILYATLRGIYLGNGLTLVLQDAVLYAFLLLAFPCKAYIAQIKTYAAPIIVAFLIGTFSMTCITFLRYSKGFGMIHDAYYTWIRDIAGGKVTDLGYGFFRIVSSEHLFIIPVLLILFAILVRKIKTAPQTLYWGLMVMSITILLIDFTRIYFLAGLIGATVLISRTHIQLWLRTAIICTVLSVTLFMGISFVASRGAIIGAELIGMKTASITMPNTDVSAATRLLIWPEAVQKIKTYPVFGSGLATSVTIIDPVSNTPTTRTQFDMGYVEMIVELGGIGALIYLTFVLHIAYLLWRYGYSEAQSTIAKALFASIIALCTINITTPALFQGYGVVYLAICLAYIQTEPKINNI